MNKERKCTVVGKKLSPYGNWVWLDLFTGSIIQCEQYMDTHEWHLEGYKNMKVVSAEPKPKPNKIRIKHEQQEEQPRRQNQCKLCED